MRRPLTGEILAGIVASLRGDVLPTITDAGAQRQMRAALFSLGRIQRAWDRWPGYLRADNDDMRETLDRVLGGLAANDGPDGRIRVLQDRLASTRDCLATTDPCSMDALGMLNERLQALVCDTGDLVRDDPAGGDTAAQALEALYARMVAREIDAWASNAA